MADTVWKFPFEVGDLVRVQMPAGAQVLAVDDQVVKGGWVSCLWARVDPEAPMKERRFAMRGTGHPFTGEEGAHVGTWQSGPFVWHLFEADRG